MRHDVFGAMPIDELWTLHQTIVSILAEKLEGEKAKLQDRLDELNRKPGRPLTEASRPRPYRKVNPKFRNPERPSETWGGRGEAASLGQRATGSRSKHGRISDRVNTRGRL